MNALEKILSAISSFLGYHKQEKSYLSELSREEFEPENPIESTGSDDFFEEEELILTKESVKKLKKKDLVEIAELLNLKVTKKDNKQSLVRKICKDRNLK